ncbi:AMP-binding protein [Gordonia sp. HY285]|uniref:class I adenylate-forming enzyme family protein n=1 Tax=Gordonia liuliyuniae TaxID=2911517 RepID=UPI001F3D9690|nr:AMP-binding protein [Gordonia liuliyuniae]MCF8608931.1 AMP-binding protein [Gordonia liuliyuniae]
MTLGQRSSIAFAPTDVNSVCATEGDRTLTWAELDDHSNRLASSLATQGIGAGDAVAIRLHTRLEWLVVSLGIAKVGGTAVAINYKLTPPEATYILRDCNVRGAIVDDADPRTLIEAWSELDLFAIVTLDQRAPGASFYDHMIAIGSTDPRPVDDFAPIVIYSSGTTGAPKGAPLGGWRTPPDARIFAEYSASVNFDGASAGPGCCSLINLPMHHGAGPSYTRGTLKANGTVIFQRRFDPAETLRLIEKHRVTNWTAVPTMLQRILALPEETLTRSDLSSIKYIAGGAAPFGSHIKEKVTDLFGEVLHEMYGCTEAGMLTGATPSDLRERPTSSGRPFRHVDLKIIDEDGTSLTTGVTGEIAVRTPVVIEGYIGRGPLGSDRLLPDGFYRTGDVGHVDDAGYLYIHDRITDMIIAGGTNIYPAEIEAVLNAHPDVVMAAVLGVPHEELGEQPIAAIQRREGSTVTAADILTYCEGQLAKFKWPRKFYFINKMPISPMGKLLKRELRTELL